MRGFVKRIVSGVNNAESYLHCSCTFIITGRVIKGWDIAVATMRRGETCELTCSSEYAYGTKGYPPHIHPDATLVFEIQLLSWKGKFV